MCDHALVPAATNLEVSYRDVRKTLASWSPLGGSQLKGLQSSNNLIFISFLRDRGRDGPLAQLLARHLTGLQSQVLDSLQVLNPCQSNAHRVGGEGVYLKHLMTNIYNIFLEMLVSTYLGS